VSGRVEGKVCVVTGAGRGIGRAAALRLAQEGGRVVCADVDEAAGEAVRAEIEAAGGDALAVRVDVTDAASVEALYAAAATRYGRIDVCCDNAGILLPEDGTPEETSLETWQRIVAVNQTGVFLCLKHQLPHLVRAGGGSIVITASFVAVVGAATPQTAYDATKGAVLQMTRNVAVTYAKQGVRCNAVCPGPIETPLMRVLFDQASGGEARRLVHQPTGRFGRAEEVANAILYLASDESSYVTGTALMVDGGASIAYTTPL
jgi:NAD(P)-dependent dehydrogenase (short-subunit alcohol dehydrogenase family)